MKKTIILLSLFCLLLLLDYFGMHFVENLNLQFWPRHAEIAEMAIIVAFVVYIILMTIPFMPSIEIGLALMVILGKEGIILVYVCTILALCLSFLVGKLIPAKWIAGFFKFFKLKRAFHFVLKIDKLEQKERVPFLLEKLPNKLFPSLIKYRYFLLGVLFNIPGNSIIGGGGGIGLVAGMSGLFNTSSYILVTILAVSPIPLLLWFGFLDF